MYVLGCPDNILTTGTLAVTVAVVTRSAIIGQTVTLAVEYPTQNMLWWHSAWVLDD
jgi:hypothetical protein